MVVADRMSENVGGADQPVAIVVIERNSPIPIGRGLQLRSSANRSSHLQIRKGPGPGIAQSAGNAALDPAKIPRTALKAVGTF